MSASGGKRILILYTSIGLGHKYIAENVGYYLSRLGFEVLLHDAHKVQDGSTVVGGTKLYAFILGKVPFVWEFLYNSKIFLFLSLPLRIRVAAFNFEKTLKKVNELNPDIIITTQTSASSVIAYLKKKNLYKGKFGIAFSDFHLHRYWMYDPYADFYLANVEEQKQEMIALGVPPNKIFVSGIPMRSKKEIDAPTLRKKLDISENQKVVLMASGSQGTGIDENLISKFLAHPQIKIIVVCGKNKQLYEELKPKFDGTNVVILAFYSPMEELYAIADIFITKAGGLSVAEGLYWNLPIIISHLLPGQEQHNYNYLLEKELVMPKPKNLVEEVLEEVKTGKFRQKLKANSAAQNLFNRTQNIELAVTAQYKK